MLELEVREKENVTRQLQEELRVSEMDSGPGSRKSSWKQWNDRSADIFPGMSNFSGKRRKMEGPSWDCAWMKAMKHTSGCFWRWREEWRLKMAELWELNKKRIPWQLVYWRPRFVDFQLTVEGNIGFIEKAFFAAKWLLCPYTRAGSTREKLNWNWALDTEC